MNNKNEECERKSKSCKSSESKSHEQMPMYPMPMQMCPMQNYNPCMCCPMMSGEMNMQGSIMKYGREDSIEEEDYRMYHGGNQGNNQGNNYGRLINQPVGVSLTNGQGVSGVLCSVTNREINLLEYLYHSQFATKHYPLNQIQDIYRFPRCSNPNPNPNPGWVY